MNCFFAVSARCLFDICESYLLSRSGTNQVNCSEQAVPQFCGLPCDCGLKKKNPQALAIFADLPPILITESLRARAAALDYVRLVAVHRPSASATGYGCTPDRSRDPECSGPSLL